MQDPQAALPPGGGQQRPLPHTPPNGYTVDPYGIVPE